ncbi:RNase H domain-containing protein, partial [Aphis craccivora]
TYRIIFDSKLHWLPFLKYIRDSISKKHNIIKIIAHTSWGRDIQTNLNTVITLSIGGFKFSPIESICRNIANKITPDIVRRKNITYSFLMSKNEPLLCYNDCYGVLGIVNHIITDCQKP